MPLFAYNLTGVPVALAAGSPVVTLPASVAPPARGTTYNVTSELRPSLAVDPVNGKAGGVEAAGFALIQQAQVTGGLIALEWTSDPEYLTTGLLVGGPVPGPHDLVSPSHTASGLTAGHVVRATGATAFAWLPPVGVYTTATRPSAASVLVGTMIFNTDDPAAPNWSNGTNWVDASGNLT